MTLRKSKIGIVTDIIYALLAGAFCIIAIMDAAQEFGFSYLPGLLAFAVMIAAGFGLRKLLSFLAVSDRYKEITEMGDSYGRFILAFIIVISIVFRIISYAWNGLGGNVYFDIAKVTGNNMGHFSHAVDEWYIAALHAILFLFGNRIFVAAIFNCILQSVGVILGFFAFRKMLGIIPASGFALFWTITGFSVYEAMTLNSRNLEFLLITLALFVISKCIPATDGKFFCYLISGLLTAVCIYADIAGLILIPFIFGIMFVNDGEGSGQPALRARKMLFALVSIVFGLVLIIFLDSFFTSSNPSGVLNSILALYEPSGSFNLGFSYMTAYREVTVMAVICALGLFAGFFEETDRKSILLASVIVIILVNNLGCTYLENDGREAFFMLCSLFAGIAVRELLPAKATGDIFKASAELYDNEISYPDEGYVPSALRNASSDDMDDFDDEDDGSLGEAGNADDKSGSEAAEDDSPADAQKGGSEDKKETASGKENTSVSDAGQSGTSGQTGASGQNGASMQDKKADDRTGAKEADNARSGAGNADAASGAGKGDDPAKEYVPYRKPQLRPEFRRRPGAWAQELAARKNDSVAGGIKLGAIDRQEEDKEAEAAKADTNASEPEKEIAPNGAVLLHNPIPHPARKTEHKPMEFDITVPDSKMDYDLKIADDDDFDI